MLAVPLVAASANPPLGVTLSCRDADRGVSDGSDLGEASVRVVVVPAHGGLPRR